MSKNVDTETSHVVCGNSVYWCGATYAPHDLVITAGYAFSRLKRGEGGVCEGCLLAMAGFIDQQAGSEIAMAYKQKPPTPRPEPMPGLLPHSEESRVFKLPFSIFLVCLAVVIVLLLLKVIGAFPGLWWTS